MSEVESRDREQVKTAGTLEGSKGREPAYVIGIDLGTTNCAVAFASLVKGEAGYGQVRSFPVEQLVAPGQTEACDLLPSTIYLPGPHEISAGALGLPWSSGKQGAPGAVSGEAPAPQGTSSQSVQEEGAGSASPIYSVVGQLARHQGAKVPGRLVTSTKSWLCYGGVDRTARILPWGAPAQIPRISPVEASALVLSHIRKSWNHHHPQAPMEEQEVVLTVPASFDEPARALTLQAALDGGLPGARLVLLEEPQAAFHDYLISRGGEPLSLSPDGDGQEKSTDTEELILVVDVGGGTTDLTLISHSRPAQGGDEGPGALRRMAVGEHILLGGDNMDMALAHMVEERLTGRRGSLDPERWATLCHNCRNAKEALLGRVDGGAAGGAVGADRAAVDGEAGAPDGEPSSPRTYTVVLPGRGSRLLGGSMSATITKEEVEQVVLEGFFPRVPFDGWVEPGPATGDGAHGVPNVQSALSEWGLPYATEPAITRHVAAFLQRHGVGTGNYPMPTAILLNGGVFKAQALAERIIDVVSRWVDSHGVGAGAGESRLRVLRTDDADGAVARGAAQYGLVRRGMGTRIEARTARAYYVGVLSSSPRSPDSPRKGRNRMVGLCILPRNHDPSIPVHLKERVFNLWVGRPVRFMLYTSTTDWDSKLGDEVEIGSPGGGSGSGGKDPMGLVPLPPVQTVFTGEGGRVQIPVTLKAVPTELGLVEIWCVAVDRDAQWKLEFNLRGSQNDGGQGESEEDSQQDATGASDGDGPARQRPVNRGLGVSAKSLARAGEHIDLFFGRTPVALDPREVRRVIITLENALHMKRQNWQLPLLRELWEMLRPGIRRRRRSADHETAFFSLAGYFLRPGFGFPFDDWRVGELAAILPDGVQYGNDPRTWQAWWVMWRRVAGGLDQGLQEALLETITPWVRPDLGLTRPKGQRPQNTEEMIRLVAALERISPVLKADWGDMFLKQLLDGESPARSGWALARLGARVPLYGSAHLVVDRDVVGGWVESLLPLDWAKVDNASFAAAHLSRVSGDRHRDLDGHLREQVAKKLSRTGAAPIMSRMVLEPVKLESREQGQLYGESLPLGLTMLK